MVTSQIVWCLFYLIYYVFDTEAWVQLERKSPRSPSANRLSNEIDDDDSEALSAFGTREYWDDVYSGRGDFPADEYTWYFGFEGYQKLVKQYIPKKDCRVFIPGIGNDPILLDLLQEGYNQLTATDYVQNAIERQRDLLSYESYSEESVELFTMDCRKLNEDWDSRFDALIEKGTLDAIYLSGGESLELTAAEFQRVLKPGGVLLSISGVVPEDVRKKVFKDWDWIQDGSSDLKAGCFVLSRRPE